MLSIPTTRRRNAVTIDMVAGADPDKPAIGSIEVGENWANVSWRPAEGERINPGDHFYVEYVKVSDAGLRLCCFSR